MRTRHTINGHFSTECRQCHRLATFLDDVKADHPDYFCRPVPSFGDPTARLLIVGLAPGMHGANRTGRPFTGDFAGVLLYQTLYKFGFSVAPSSESVDDGLQLYDCRITNAVRCLPPNNKPIAEEINQCNAYLIDEIKQLEKGSVIIALGAIAHKAVIRATGGRQNDYSFRHAAQFTLDEGQYLIDSYHCSRYNTQTKRLTPAMFEEVFRLARERLD